MPILQQLAPKEPRMIDLPKVPKIADLVTAIQHLDTRLDALEDKAATVEHGLIEHQAGAIERLQEIERLRAQLERDRWDQPIQEDPPMTHLAAILFVIGLILGYLVCRAGV